MSLLDDVSIVVTPNGYKAGELYAVIPVPTLGSEEVVNGDFATDTDWTKGTGWTISGGTATYNNLGVANNLTQNIGGVIGKVYEVKFTTKSDVSGALAIALSSSYTSISVSADTEYSLKITSNGASLVIRATTNFTGSIDNVSVKEWVGADMDVTRATAATRVDEDGLVNYAEVIGGEEVACGNFECAVPLDSWSTGTGWTINTVTGEADASVGAYTNLIQSINFTDGATYIIEFTISKITSGNVRFYTSGSSSLNIGITRSSLGTFTESFTVSGIKDAINFSSATGFIGSIDNVSIKEIQRDNVPRIDYTGGGCPHILAEPERTNLITYSSDFSSWNNFNSNYTANQGVSPDGNNTMDLITYSSIGGSLYKSLPTVSGTTYTVSIWLATQSGSVDVKIGNINAGVYETKSVTTTPTRFYITQVASADNRLFAIESLGIYSVLVWGAQLEAGSYATSYIPTSGSTVTRNQDIFTRDGIGSLINSTEGVLFVEMAALSNDSVQKFISLSDGTTTNRIILGYDNVSNRVISFARVGGGLSFDIKVVVSNVQDYNKLAIKWKENDFALWINGVEVGTDASGSSFPSGTLIDLKFSDADGTTEIFNGKVKQIQVYDTSLSDEQLLQLTGESGTDFYESYAEMASALTYTIQ